MEPLLHAVLDGRVPEAFRAAYHRSAVHGYRLLRAGAELCRALEDRGIPCLGLRGPFLAAGLYGDPALRYATDVDVLVPAPRRDAALATARDAGFGMRDGARPLWYYRRAHLHWPLESREAGVLCDLHWSLDQPFQLHRIDYEGLFRRSRRRTFEGLPWREPSPEDLLLVSCVHLAKECRQQGLWRGGLSPAEVAESRRGLLTLWMDIALQAARRCAEIDWPRALAAAADWRVLPAVAWGLRGARELFGVSVPEVPGGAAPEVRFPDLERARAVRALARWAGFRPACVGEAAAYILPHSGFLDARTLPGRAAARCSHGVKAVVGIAGAAAAALCCAPLVRARKRGGRGR
jgi:hypothetical protein